MYCVSGNITQRSCNSCYIIENPTQYLDLLIECYTEYKSFENLEWLCNTYRQDLYSGLVPKWLITNKIGFPTKPKVLKLHPLEVALIALIIAFMTSHELAVGSQKSIWQNICHVPVDVDSK